MPSQPRAQACLNTTPPGSMNTLLSTKPDRLVAQQLRQLGLAILDRLAPQIAAVEFEQVEGAEGDAAIMPVSAKKLEVGEPVAVAGDRLAVDQAGAGDTEVGRQAEFESCELSS
jgi:hypothetical protein